LGKYKGLFLENADMAGWISIAGTTINYPVMQTPNEPDYYLGRSFNKSYSDLGTPYIQENCSITESDNLILYGHHIKGGRMFGALEDYKSGLTEQKEHIVHVHLKDGYPHYFGEDGFAPQRLSCTILGEGELDILWVLESLKEMDYEGYVSVEYESWHKEYGLPEVEEGLCRCKDYLLREDKETARSEQ
jgi:hypothetical protein